MNAKAKALVEKLLSEASPQQDKDARSWYKAVAAAVDDPDLVRGKKVTVRASGIKLVPDGVTSVISANITVVGPTGVKLSFGRLSASGEIGPDLASHPLYPVASAVRDALCTGRSNGSVIDDIISAVTMKIEDCCCGDGGQSCSTRFKCITGESDEDQYY